MWLNPYSTLISKWCEKLRKKWVLAGLVGNGMLAHKPEWNEEGGGRLVTTEGMSWREGMSLGTSRMRSLD